MLHIFTLERKYNLISCSYTSIYVASMQIKIACVYLSLNLHLKSTCVHQYPQLQLQIYSYSIDILQLYKYIVISTNK